MNIINHYIPVNLHFGRGVLNELATVTLPGKKALLVMSSGRSMKTSGTLQRVIDLLKQNNVECVVFDKIQPNPVRRHVNEGAEVARQNNCDFVIGLGGGSPIDSAKAIAVAAVNPGDYWDYIHGGTGKGKDVAKALPIIAIPTTAGTGTEADPWSVITKEETNEKIGAGWPCTFPAISLVDPELMVTIPPLFTAYQGFDAFFHAAEGFIAKCANPISDLYAGKSLTLLYNNLATAVADGKNIEARSNVALASMLSGMVESTSSCTSEHSLEHAMSAYYPALPHGAGLIMLSNAYFGFFVQAIPARVAEMARVMLNNADATAEDFLAALRDLQTRCGVGCLKMSEYGISPADFPKFAVNSRDNMGGLFEVDAVSLTDTDIIDIYQKSYY